MTSLQIHQFDYYNDNYGVLIHDPESGDTVAIDAGDADPYLNEAKLKGWNITQIWITHHHWDHTDGLAKLKQETKAKVFGPSKQSTAIVGLDVLLNEGDEIEFANRKVEVLETPGHTLDMINFYLPDDDTIFVGDTLFALGCGRLLEGTPSMMWSSLQKLAKLPAKTTVYCSHEYSLANATFALSVDPENEALKERAEQIANLREKGQPTVPFTLETELATNPFLRPDDEKIRSTLGMENQSDEAVFTEIRKRKDNF
ncbi:hydroxyacylglutathione hydrolase [Ahrensia sp. 13_GOM-1096m]|uniref:hydroxyacylglutathione hydrolase n=1 Tax=Ahrensia sp. 13_GOM-1096m TaxID=1380380 RepID=UPI00047915A7|nr:hydroxyacylglutathione hydrolase [Ahrensia sp. 13_GOM-1096m]